jgi:hypothetical protein
VNEINPVALVLGACFGGMMGFYCGKIPYNAAMKRRREGLAMAGMTLSVMFGLVGGCLLALPFALVFTGFVTMLGEAAGAPAWDDPGYRPRDRRRDSRGLADTPPPTRPYTEIGHLVVCGACRMATGKADGCAPPACPHCGHQFAASIPRPKRRKGDDDGFVPLQLADPTR